MPTNITSFDAYRNPSDRTSKSAKVSPEGFGERVPPPPPPLRLAPSPILTDPQYAAI
ncbi:hypothetical protein PDE_06612 [Penicillium oxalicum 114-2]|uniref:Uncharacterized protein n=1 Tax=Penicillium oxalicum (strain 114-2 / CGMCC 5302) TaxID=933388 RepID=S7ZLW9_PENO1|nr:hypothetical protein PDE_06612 [Penicillium oxalicum 114-2]